jgi:predicted Zn-dependent protease
MKTICSILLLTLLIFISSCAQVGITGRKQLNFMPDSVMNSMSLTQYDEFIKQNKLSKNKQQTKTVKRVGKAIAKAITKYCKDQNIQSDLLNCNWEFNLIESKQVNAWAMPGGKVVVYTGLLPVAKTEAGLAVVMGHEIAHVFAKHGAERMTQNMLLQLGNIALAKALEEKPEATKKLFLASYGLGSKIGLLLPFSRLHESEADRLGLIFMAMAGYNPQEAINFWQRMADAGKDKSKPMKLLSTHPSDIKRINDLKIHLPEAKKIYKHPQ